MPSLVEQAWERGRPALDEGGTPSSQSVPWRGQRCPPRSQGGLAARIGIVRGGHLVEVVRPVLLAALAQFP